MDINKAKKVFGGAGDEGNKPNFLNKTDEIVYSAGRRSFDDVRKKIMHTDRQKFIWGPRFDEKKLDLDFDKDPLKKGFSFFSIGLFAFSMIMMISAIVYAYYSFTTGGFSVRQDKIILQLEIPTLTSAGQDITGQIIIGNENRTMFKEAYVTLEIDDNAGEPAKIVNQIQVGDVGVGDKIYKNISLNLSGLEGEEKKVNAVLYYRVPQTESTFQKITSQKVLITKSPVVMSVTGPTTLSVAQDGEYLVTVRGISKIIPSLYLTLEIPKQMKILKANFPEVAKGVYNLGPINEGDERVLKFTGSFINSEELGEKFTVKVRAGKGEENEVKAYFAESTYGINLTKNPISVFFVGGNNQRGEKISFTGKQPKLNLVLQNNGNVRVKDVEMEVKFSGGLFDSKNVTVDGAVYDSTTFTALANGSNNEEIREIDPGEQIIFPIEFSQLQNISNASGRNVKIEVSFTSNTEDGDGKPVTQRISSTLSPSESSTASLTTYHFSGAFKNSGPMPPTIGQTTTYTINLLVDTNQGFNSGKFIVPLQPNVKFIKALDNTVVYNKDTKIVTWNVGNLVKATSTAFGVASKGTSIQVSILPTPDQVRTAPLLTTGARFEGVTADKDKQNFTLVSNDATIVIQTDPKYENNKGYDSVGE
jgi:hypothetical protein